ncbi:MAG TPA: pitrilysin family protein [Verrucomicrobiae bacterium]|nr:pitrilysin family protein [Verrucomicrobiae bacterium]
MRFPGFIIAFALLSSSLPASAQSKSPEIARVTRATLDNGLKVVVVRDPLAPVATVELNYLVGGDETPAGFPGMAHAQEHMAFRGCSTLSADQIAAIFAQLGGAGNADTQQNITQYFETVPASDLDVALRANADCMRNVEDSQAEWAKEKGAIEQEVARDLSNPTYKFLTRMNEDMFAGTVYSHDALGTKESFDATTGAMLKKFYDTWYAPNDAILIVTGDVQPDEVLSKVKDYYGTIPRKSLPARPGVALPSVKSESFTLESNLPYLLAFIAYRMPGTDSPDFAAVEILCDVLSSQRGNLYALVPQGKALGTEFGLAEAFPKASVAYSAAALPADAESASIIQDMRGIVADYAKNGVPEDLVVAAKRREIVGAEFRRASISGLADAWSDALAAEGRNSPDDDINAIKRVTLQDVNRVARQFLLDQNSITATLKPTPSGAAVASKGFGGAEELTSAPTKPVQLPAWASSELLSLQVPPPPPPVADMKLPNGLRLIVRTINITPTVSVIGNVRNDPKMETPPGQDGVAAILANLFSYGTKNLDRLAFQKALDDIAANESAGFDFSLQVMKDDFSRGVQLLADNELNPALPEQAFDIVKPQTAQFVAGQLKSPGYRAHRALDLALFPAGDPVLRETTPQSVSSLTLADLNSFYSKTIRPDLTTIVVVGDVTPAEAKAVIEKWFGSWKVSGPAPQVDLPPVPENKPSAATVPDPTQLQDTVTLSETLPMNRFDPDYYPLQLGDHVLGGGFYATRLYRDLREINGYVYSVSVGLDASKTRTVYSVRYACDPKNVSKARLLIIRDLNSMQKEDVTPAELQQAKALLLRQIPLGESSEDDLAGGLLARAQIGLPLDEPVRAAKLYFSMTAAQVRAAFDKRIRPAGFVQIVRGPAPE